MDLWTVYNSEESWLPFWIPMIVWTGSYVYCQLPRKAGEGTPFHRWYTLHNFHNYGAILIGWISMYHNDDKIFNERIAILWSLGYFVVDLVDCASRMDVTYLLHAIMCLFLGVVNYSTPVNRVLRLNSRAAQCELSNPVMHLAKKTRKSLHFVSFALVFTLCRILWIPFYLIMPFREAGIQWADFRMVILIAFYGLNLFWYAKIIRILITGVKKVKEENVD